MTLAAKDRRAVRHEIEPMVREYLHTRSAMRYRSTAGAIRAAARKITARAVAQYRREQLAA